MRILCIGHVAFDTTVLTDSYPVENTKNVVPKKVECGGGPSSNAAYLLGCWGCDVEFIGVVGNDYQGQKVKEEFDQVHVDTSHLKLKDDYSTSTSFIIANTTIGSRTILTYHSKSITYGELGEIKKPDLILLDGREYELSKKVLETYPDAISVIDASHTTEETIGLSKMVDYIVCSHEFAEGMTNVSLKRKDKDTLKQCYQKMEEIFHNHIVITLEATGSLYKEEDQLKIMPTIKVKAVDSTGAGDLYHGGFVYGLSQKLPLEKVVRIATVAGGLAVTKVGGRYSVASKEEMRNYIADFK